MLSDNPLEAAKCIVLEGNKMQPAGSGGGENLAGAQGMQASAQ